MKDFIEAVTVLKTVDLATHQSHREMKRLDEL